MIVDAHGQTNQPHIYALGDVSNKMNLTPVAIAEGHMLADRLFGSQQPRNWNFDTVATAVFSHPPIATVGLSEEVAATRYPVDIYVARFTPMRHTMTGRHAQTTMKLVVEQSTQRVVGAHMLGDDAPEMMQGIAIAVTAAPPRPISTAPSASTPPAPKNGSPYAPAPGKPALPKPPSSAARRPARWLHMAIAALPLLAPYPASARGNSHSGPTPTCRNGCKPLSPAQVQSLREHPGELPPQIGRKSVQ